MKNKITYEFLKKNDLILFEAIVGSQAYGTSTPDSDIDKKFIYILPEDDIFGFDYIESLEVNKDYFGWEIKKFLELIKVNNPTAIEFLNSPERCIIHKSKHFDNILKNKNKFLSKLALKAFTGYASQQINKATGLDKKQNWEVERVTRKSILDFVYVIEDSGIVPWKKWNERRGNYYEVKFCGLSKIPRNKDLYALYYDTNAHLCFAKGMDEKDREHNKALFKKKGTPMGFGYKGMIKEKEEDNSPVSNQLRTSSIPKNQDVLAYITYNKDGYTKHCKDYNSYQKWLTERNEVRYVEVKGHGQKIDGKNMLHCVRLIDMGIEIGQGKGVIVERDNAEYLLKIRRGELNLNELLELANERLNFMNEVYDNCSLPETPDYSLINDLLVDIRNKVYNKNKLKKFVLDLINEVRSESKDLAKVKVNKVIDFKRVDELNVILDKLNEYLERLKHEI